MLRGGRRTCRSWKRLAYLKAQAAQHWPAQVGLEWDRSFDAALGAGDAHFGRRPLVQPVVLGPARPAACGVVSEFSFAEKDLFADSENELGSTCDAD